MLLFVLRNQKILEFLYTGAIYDKEKGIQKKILGIYDLRLTMVPTMVKCNIDVPRAIGKFEL